MSGQGIRVHALVGENGSDDGTRYLLSAASASTGLLTVVDTAVMSNSTDRLERMALGRQLLADRAKSLSASARVVCVIDVDEPFLDHVSATALNVVLQKLSSCHSLFAVSATSKPSYYDLLAYEDEHTSFHDLEERLRRLRGNPYRYYMLFKNTIYPEQDRLTRTFDFTCTSAFNGMCFYKGESYHFGSYRPRADVPSVCEHVTFNRSMVAATGGYMEVNASLVLPMPKEHGRRTLPGFLWQRLRKLPAFVSNKVRFS